MFALPPKWISALILMSIALAMVPPAIIARARTSKTQAPRIHYIQDMDAQAKVKTQTTFGLFADDRGMRPRVEGSVPRSEVPDDAHLQFGLLDGAWATTPPPALPVTMARLERGQARYNIFCTPCHGQAGYGDGIVHQRAMVLVNNPAIGNGTSWVQPKNIHDPEVRVQPIGQIFNSITNGVRNMAGYSAQIPTDDRWAIAMYVQALQRSQNARPTDVTPAEVDSMPVISYLVEEGEG